MYIFVVLSLDFYCIIGSMLEAILCSVACLPLLRFSDYKIPNLSNDLVFNTGCFSVPYIAAVVILAAGFAGFCKTRQKEAMGGQWAMLEESVNFDIIDHEVLVGGGVTWLDSQLTEQQTEGH